MKRNLLFKLTLAYTIAFLSFQNVRAQNKEHYWSVAGNSKANSRSKLGTTNATNLRIVTNNLERIRVTSRGLVGIGTNSPTYNLHVMGNGLFTTGLIVSDGGILSKNSSGIGVSGTGSSYGLYGSGSTYGVYGTGGSYGVYGVGSTGISGSNGVYGSGSGNTSIGVFGTDGVSLKGSNSSGSGVSGSGSNFGVSGYSGGTGVYGIGGNFGVYGSGAQFGVCGSAIQYGVYGNSAFGGYAGYFNGNVYSTGTYQGSDRKLKTNIVDFSSAMDIINKLSPKTYQYRQDGNYKLMNMPVGDHYGLIAQDVEQLLPNLVKDTKFETRMAQPEVKDQLISKEPNLSGGNSNQTQPTATMFETIDFKAVNYIELIPIMIKGMQEQQQQIEELKNQLAKLTPDLKTVLSGSLGQNAPNPVSNSTRIQYSIPSGNNTAQLLLTDNLGRTIKAVQLNSSGFINLDASALYSGTYNYSLIIDGKIVDTKKMVVTKN